MAGGCVVGTWAPEMVDEVTAAPVSSRDEYGTVTFGTQVAVACRYEPDAVALRDQEVVDYADLLITETALDSSDTIRGGWHDAGIWLPGMDTGDDAAALRPKRVTRTADLDGNDVLFEVLL